MRLRRSLRVAADSLRRVSRRTASTLGRALPLTTQQTLVAFIGRQTLPTPFRFEFALGNAYRSAARRLPLRSTGFSARIIWRTPQGMRSRTRLDPLRSIQPGTSFLNSVSADLRSCGLDGGGDIGSVLEIGCSQGCLLRHLETTMFRSATILYGVHLRAYAIRTAQHTSIPWGPE